MLNVKCNIMSIWENFNFRKQCRNFGIKLWQCPNFLFLVMGLIVIFSIIATYLIANRYITEPLEVSLVVLVVAAVMFIIGYLIVRGFDFIAEANIFKSEFISIISHEIRSPLTSLKWSVNLLSNYKLDKEVKDHLDMMKEETNQVIKLVQILNDVGKIELGQVQLNKEPSDIPMLTEEALREEDAFAKEKKIKIVFDYDKNLPKILIDPDKIKLVIKSLIDNAIRYNRENGKVDIAISRENSKIRWQIKDTGVGISREQRKRIFQKFSRLNSPLRYQTKGLGLNLFISKYIVQAMGGEINFKSNEGGGSTFWFKLPIS